MAEDILQNGKAGASRNLCSLVVLFMDCKKIITNEVHSAHTKILFMTGGLDGFGWR
jgi:hypothetical protein